MSRLIQVHLFYTLIILLHSWSANDPSLTFTSRSAPSQPRPPPAISVPVSDLVRLPDNRTVRRHRIANDVHRILAFKKLTRTLHNLAQNRANISSSNFGNRPTTSHSTPRGNCLDTFLIICLYLPQ